MGSSCDREHHATAFRPSCCNNGRHPVHPAPARCPRALACRQTQEVAQLYRDAPALSKSRVKVPSTADMQPMARMQADTISLKGLPSGRYTGVINIIDVFTQYSWQIPVQTVGSASEAGGGGGSGSARSNQRQGMRVQQRWFMETHVRCCWLFWTRLGQRIHEAKVWRLARSAECHAPCAERRLSGPRFAGSGTCYWHSLLRPLMPAASTCYMAQRSCLRRRIRIFTAASARRSPPARTSGR
jgi:hypothetical protein